MGGSGKTFIPVFLIVPLHVARVKVAVIAMISWLPPDHWDPKTKDFFLPLDHCLGSSTQTENALSGAHDLP
jgi:hypothetical protein